MDCVVGASPGMPAKPETPKGISAWLLNGIFWAVRSFPRPFATMDTSSSRPVRVSRLTSNWSTRSRSRMIAVSACTLQPSTNAPTSPATSCPRPESEPSAGAHAEASTLPNSPTDASSLGCRTLAIMLMAFRWARMCLTAQLKSKRHDVAEAFSTPIAIAAISHGVSISPLTNHVAMSASDIISDDSNMFLGFRWRSLPSRVVRFRPQPSHGTLPAAAEDP
mmetsp:Transcript_115962/g.368833  ORF Transcript_115962/g.368833 Transcript_115962/m.368833 type:complete len:221 (+) Transcript_115962:1500-2162(+)